MIAFARHQFPQDFLLDLNLLLREHLARTGGVRTVAHLAVSSQAECAICCQCWWLFAVCCLLSVVSAYGCLLPFLLLSRQHHASGNQVRTLQALFSVMGRDGNETEVAALQSICLQLEKTITSTSADALCNNKTGMLTTFFDLLGNLPCAVLLGTN